MDNDVAVSVNLVSKNFKLPHDKADSVKSLFVNPFNKSRKKFELQHALRGVSFDVKRGEFFGIVGRNGSGKSTLLKIIAGIYQPNKGKVTINGRLVPFIELGVGFNPELTGRENVYLNGALLGFSEKEVDKKYASIVNFAELERFMDQKLKNYSSGMQVRLAFSVATMLAESDILLIDEVLAVGDADFQRKCFEYFKRLKQNKKTVIFVSHDMGAVREYCDRAIMIKDGSIAYDGTADKVSDEYLKLFNQSSEDLSSKNTNAEASRWGNGQVRISDLSVDLSDDKIIVTADLKAGKTDVKDVVFGFRFKDSENRVVMGSNTLNAAGGKKFSMDAGSTKKLIFTMQNIMGSGTFAVSATARLSDKVTICDDWDNVTHFSNTNRESFYPIVAPAKLEIK